MKAKAAAPGTLKAQLVGFVKEAGLAKYKANEMGDPDPNSRANGVRSLRLDDARSRLMLAALDCGPSFL